MLRASESIRWGNKDSPDARKESVNQYLAKHENEFIGFVIQNGIYADEKKVSEYIKEQVEKMLQDARRN